VRACWNDFFPVEPPLYSSSPLFAFSVSAYVDARRGIAGRARSAFNLLVSGWRGVLGLRSPRRAGESSGSLLRRSAKGNPLKELVNELLLAELERRRAIAAIIEALGDFGSYNECVLS
jgi:hypothetical protein